MDDPTRDQVDTGLINPKSDRYDPEIWDETCAEYASFLKSQNPDHATNRHAAGEVKYELEKFMLGSFENLSQARQDDVAGCLTNVLEARALEAQEQRANLGLEVAPAEQQPAADRSAIGTGPAAGAQSVDREAIQASLQGIEQGTNERVSRDQLDRVTQAALPDNAQAAARASLDDPGPNTTPVAPEHRDALLEAQRDSENRWEASRARAAQGIER